MNAEKIADIIKLSDELNSVELDFVITHIKTKEGTFPASAKWGDTPLPTSLKWGDLSPPTQETAPWMRISLAEVMKDQESKRPQTLGLVSFDGVKSFCGRTSCPCFYSFIDDNDPVKDDRSRIDGKKLFLSGFSPDTPWKNIREKIGRILDKKPCFPSGTFVPPDKGFAFLSFKNHRKAAAAFKILEAQEVNGNPLFVNFALKNDRGSFLRE